MLMLGLKGLKLTCPVGKGSGKSPSNQMINYDEHDVAPGQAKCESCLTKGQAGIQVVFFFSSPGSLINKNLCHQDIAVFGQVVNQA